MTKRKCALTVATWILCASRALLPVQAGSGVVRGEARIETKVRGLVTDVEFLLDRRGAARWTLQWVRMCSDRELRKINCLERKSSLLKHHNQTITKGGGLILNTQYAMRDK